MLAVGTGHKATKRGRISASVGTCSVLPLISCFKIMAAMISLSGGEGKRYDDLTRLPCSQEKVTTSLCTWQNEREAEFVNPIGWTDPQVRLVIGSVIQVR